MFSTFRSLIERRVSARRFDPRHVLSDAEVHDLVWAATRAPSAYNLQNWRFIAVRSPAGKARLRAIAYDQAKVEEASLVVILCGAIPAPKTLAERLGPFVAVGFMSEETALDWEAAAASHYADPRAGRDEAVRSASLAAAFLMLAAEAKGLASCPMVGFDAAAVERAFGLGVDEVPVMLVAIGKPAAGNGPQKPRRALAEVLSAQ